MTDEPSAEHAPRRESTHGILSGRKHNMTLTYYMRILRNRWLTVVNFVVLGVLAGAGITLLMPRVYSAAATNFVSASAAGNQPDSLYQNSQFTLNNVPSYTALVHSPSVLQPVIDQLHLKTTVPALAAEVTATNPTSTVLIVVTATSSSPKQASSIADAVSTQLAKSIESVEKPRQGGSSPVSVTNALKATTPTAPVSPRPSLNIALGLILGLTIGASVALLRDHFDTSVHSSEDLQRLSGVAPLGEVPYEASIAEQPLVALRHDSIAVESFRTIRTNLQFVDVDNPPKQIVITSALSNEGKTVTACNLALALAQGPSKVCLVEGDLRLPKAASYFGLNGAVGLTNVVTGQYLLDEVLVPWNRSQITVLPAGTTPPDPSQLLGSLAVQDILAQLRERFDVVIIDAPPVLPVSDAAVLSAASDGAVLVVRQGQTHRDSVSEAIERLQNAHVHLVGTVITGVKVKRGQERYDYGQRHHEGAVEQTSLTRASVARGRRALDNASNPTATEASAKLIDDDELDPANLAPAAGQREG
ncbi:polysaccharide biosynthesis tyrosine autokinase [Leekyejoonella antrihumi]|nr:polysaccharide biosynthesis tyrosine autokinase [Leekyejoonella antrihumi]